MKTTLILSVLMLFTLNISFAQTTHIYQYDNESRLIQTDDGVKTQNYQYDNLGNRLGYQISSVVSLPDLSLTNSSITTTTVAQGQSYQVSTTVNNLGSVLGQNSILKMYLSATPTGTDVEIGSFNVASLAAGASSNLNYTVNVPANATLGSQYLVLYIDAITAITEADEDNNKNNIPITVTVPSIAELNGQNTNLSSTSVVAASSLILSSAIHNTGAINATNISVKAYLSANVTLEANDTPLTDANETIALINANTNVGYNKSVVIPVNSVAGNYYLLLVIDKDNRIPEQDETNNVVALPLTITASAMLPISNFEADNQTVTTTSTVQFTDLSTNSPTSWLWSFSGGTPSSSSVQNPSVVYNTAGIYDVTLQVFNSNGQSQEYKNLYITVNTNSRELTYVPDDNFEQALIDYGYDNGALDDYVPTANITSITTLDISSKNITDLTGIEDFESLRILNVSENQITNMNLLESSVLLEEFNCANNNLSALDISSNSNLKKLDGSNNQFTTLDASLNLKLTNVLLNNNLLESINIKNTTNSIITEFNVLNNTTNLCIQVDNETDATNGTGSYASWQKDVSSQYSESCTALGILQEELISSILIYPNPTKAFIKIKIHNNLQVSKVFIFDALGKEILKSSKDFSTIDVSKFSSGTYFLKINTDKGSVTKKIIKE